MPYNISFAKLPVVYHLTGHCESLTLTEFIYRYISVFVWHGNGRHTTKSADLQKLYNVMCAVLKVVRVHVYSYLDALKMLLYSYNCVCVCMVCPEWSEWWPLGISSSSQSVITVHLVPYSISPAAILLWAAVKLAWVVVQKAEQWLKPTILC